MLYKFKFCGKMLYIAKSTENEANVSTFPARVLSEKRKKT